MTLREDVAHSWASERWLGSRRRWRQFVGRGLAAAERPVIFQGGGEEC